MTFCIALLAFILGLFFGIYAGFESTTKSIGRFGFFTWAGKKYDCTSKTGAPT
jgi:hypothetical protein